MADGATKIRVGTAGWSIPNAAADRFAPRGTHLERYGGTFSCVEINSSFYRSHRPRTYERWASSVPPGFVFCLKVPKEITHVRRLEGCAAELERFLDESAPLGEKRAVLLVQLPPSFAFESPAVARFFASLRETYAGRIACEPRHASWFAPAAGDVLRTHEVARVAADPALDDVARCPGGWDGFAYYRWHGAPRTYYSRYDKRRIDELAASLTARRDAWCIFDNTASGAATANALTLVDTLLLETGRAQGK